MSACSQAEPLKIVVSDACINFKKLSFAELPNGQIDDLGNQADSKLTVDQIIEHNARYRVICPLEDKD